MVFQTGVGRPGSFETTPIVVGDMMYVTTAYNEATIAYDLNSRKQVWRYEHKLGTTHHLLWTQQPGGRGQRRVGIRRYAGRASHRTRFQDRQGQVGHRGG